VKAQVSEEKNITFNFLIGMHSVLELEFVRYIPKRQWEWTRQLRRGRDIILEAVMNFQHCRGQSAPIFSNMFRVASRPAHGSTKVRCIPVLLYLAQTTLPICEITFVQQSEFIRIMR
jgi:hypothetical protein